MQTIYKSQESRRKVLDLYDRQLAKLKIPYHDIYTDTTFGKTHLIETGNPGGYPLLVFHGGNSTTAYNLLSCDFLFDDFHIYSVDLIGHPGKSAETFLSPNNYDYGKWTGEVISALGYAAMRCFGGSFGAGVLAKAMCAAPDKILKAVLYVPAGIKNAPAYKIMHMMLPIVMYRLTGKQEWLKRCLLPMAVTIDNISEDTLETVEYSLNHVKIKSGMPGNVKAKDMRKCSAPALVMAAEKDCLFPAGLVLPRAEKIIPDCTAYLLKNRGHMHLLTEPEKRIIVDFLK